MVSKLNIFTVHFQLSSGDGGVLNTSDFNNLERKDLRNCSSLNICFEPEEISIPDVKITKMLIHYDGITDSPQDYFGFEYDHDLDQGFQGSPNPIVTFELNKEVDQEEFRKSIWTSSICIFPEKVRERNGEAAFQQDTSGYTSIIDQKELDGYIKQLSGAAIEPPKEISFPNGLDGYYEFELKELIGLNKPSQKTSKKKTTKQLLRAIKKISNDSYSNLSSVPDYLKKEADKSLKSDREFILEAIKVTTGESFPFASKKLRSDREIVLAAVLASNKLCSEVLELAGEKIKSDREIVLAAVNQTGFALEYANEELKSDREIVLAAVKRDGEVLKFASQEMKSDRDIVMAAVSQEGWALYDAAEEFKSDREIVLAAFLNSDIINSISNNAISCADKNLRSDREFFLAAVKRKGEVLKFASQEMKSDREIVLAAVMNDGSFDECALRFAAEEFKSDREIVMAAVSKRGAALKYADKKFNSDREIVLAAVMNDGSFDECALRFAAEEFKSDREIVLAAVSQNGSALQDACEEFKSDREIVLAAIYQTGFALQFACKEFRSDREIVLAAVSQAGDDTELEGGGYNLEFVGKELMNDMEIIFASFESNPKAFKWLLQFTEFKMNETTIQELRKKFGEKLIKKHLTVNKTELSTTDRKRYYKLLQLAEMMKQRLPKEDLERLSDLHLNPSLAE